VDTTPPRTTKYRALADALRSAIERGDYPAGGTLPTVADLRTAYGATNDTVKSAFQVLAREGLIDTGQGRRTRVLSRRPVIHTSSSYVAPTADGGQQTWTKRLAELGMRGTQRLGRVGEVPAPDDVAAELDIEPGTPVLLRPRVMLADGEPVELADSYYLLAVASGTAIAQQGLVRGGTYRIFSDRGCPLVDRQETIAFGPATETDQRDLALPSSAWVVRMLITHRTTGGAPISVDRCTLRADRYRLTYTVPVHG
jgi:GntR family transcriptional regulator